jgi:hypothetical protein
MYIGGEFMNKNVYVDPETHTLLKTLAAKERTTVKALVRFLAINFDLERRKENEKES